MSGFPWMLYRDGTMLPEHGVDYLVVADADEEATALAGGWRNELEPATPAPKKRGRPPKLAK